MRDDTPSTRKYKYMYSTKYPLGFFDAGMRATKIPLVERYVGYGDPDSTNCTYINHQSNCSAKFNLLETYVEPHRLYGTTPEPLPWDMKLPVGLINKVPMQTATAQKTARSLVHTMANQPLCNNYKKRQIPAEQWGGGRQLSMKPPGQ